jgi:NAD(P)-dependent dehydrogenase (short-subunit alcohol dehydrogenase family)
MLRLPLEELLTSLSITLGAVSAERIIADSLIYLFLLQYSKLMMISVYSMPLLDSDLDSVRKLFELNVFGVLGVTQAFAPLLVKSKGTVVNVSSVASFSPIPWHGPYCATKASLNQISDTLRQELDPFGVTVILVSFPFHLEKTSLSFNARVR